MRTAISTCVSWSPSGVVQLSVYAIIDAHMLPAETLCFIDFQRDRLGQPWSVHAMAEQPAGEAEGGGTNHGYSGPHFQDSGLSCTLS